MIDREVHRRTVGRFPDLGSLSDEVNTDGTGLALSIVREVVEAHGWQIDVTDGERSGARFEITGVETATD